MRRQDKSAQPKHMGRRLTAAAMAAVMGVGCVRLAPLQIKAQAQDAEKAGYEIYPNPHVMDYSGKDYIVKNEVNVVLEEGIDSYTKDRLDEVLDLKGITYTTSEAVVDGKTNILVGIEGSGEYVDTYADEKVTVTTDKLFDKLDSYVLDNQNGVITVVGKDTDAAFYGLTTLYHVFTQMDSYTIQEFHVEDWADVASRGFIEGYYGNPWSTEDRANLMTWGGYYKLNSYFYAPKDDPKHNAKWRELYTQEELETKIQPLAEAGNASKCKFVYALHPFMSNPINASNYDESLQTLKEKFEQTMEYGVRQIAVLADDAGVPGGANNATGWAVYIKLMEDLTNWVSSKEMQEKYPGLKVTIPFCPNDYMGNGGSAQLQYLGQNMPDSVPLVVTGGKVWGEVSQNFTTNFTSGVGRGPYMWINWPCTDNSKKHLIMGGYTTFLQPGVDPANIQGIVLNPMQQSEPSKVAIFGNACYSWNIWENAEQADQAWYDSFKYVDHNSAMETDASAALRELSKHMINQNMDSRVTALQESVELKEILNPFKEKLTAGTVTAADVDKVMAEFVKLQQAAQTYRAKAGDQNLKEQIVYWLNCWDDTTTAAIAYLNGVKAVLAKDSTNVIKYNTEGKTAFDNSKTYGFHYVDHTEYAEVGVQHIVPFINALATYVSQNAELAMDPNKVIGTFITNRTDNAVNGTEKALDGDDSTFVSYQDPVWIHTNDYVGVTYNKSIAIHNIRFLLGNGKNHFEASKLQYTTDGTEWKDIPLTDMNNAFTGTQGQYLEVVVEEDNLPENFQAMGIRLVATADNKLDAYLNVHEIQINKEQSNGPALLEGTYSSSEGLAIQSGNWNNLKDGNNGTEVWLSNTGDKTVAGAYIQYTLKEATAIGTVYFGQGGSNAGDVIKDGTLQYLGEDGQWHDAGSINSNKEQTFDLNGKNIVATAVRILNNTEVPVWWRVGEFRVMEVTKTTNSTENVYTNLDNAGVYSVQDEGKISLTSANLTLNKDQYIGVDLGNIKTVTDVVTSKLPANVVLQTSRNGITWTAYEADTDARYVRALAQADGVKLDLTEFVVSYKYVAKKSVESDFANQQASDDMRTAGTVNNVFDGDLSTIGMINGFQEAGKHITFDLGQVIHFSSIRYYIVETQLNYLRHAKFEVSVDGKDWTEVLIVGNDEFENVWDDTTAKDMQDKTLTHDSQNPGYMYAGATGLDVDGRYIRVTPLSSYNYRWTGFSEIQINGGAYVSPEANRDIVSDIVEEQGKIPSNALDGDYSTTYKPSQANGSFTYYVSQPEGLTSLRLVQLGAVSNATVTANFVDGAKEVVTLGKLNQAINEFILPEGKTLESVTVSWDEVIPEIAEIVTSTAAVEKADKAELEKALAAEQPTDTWVTDSVKAYEEAKEVAQSVYDNTYATQGVVDSALGALNSAVTNAVLKATNVTELQKLVDEMVSNDQHIYTTIRYYSYSSAVENLKAALANADNLSQTKADELKTAVENAKNALEFSTYNREVAQMTTEGYVALNQSLYSKATFDAVTAAKEAIEALLAKDDATPMDFIQAVADYQAAVDALADITGLKAEIAKADTVDAALYTTESYQAYMDAVEAAKALLETGTKEQVNEAVSNLQALFQALELSPDTELGALVAQAEALKGENYTQASYDAMMALVEEAKANPADRSYIQKIADAMKALVNVEALKAQYTAAQAVEAEKYTTSSYKVLSDLMGQVDALLKSGTQEQVSALTTQLDTAIRSLVVRATGVEDYRNGITLEAADGYTAESYQAYKDAYDALMAADPANLSADAFAQLKANFEQAKLNLKHVEAEKPQNNTPGSDVQTGDTLNLVPYVLAVAVCAAGLGALVMVKSKKRG